jgi:hypothetical protein
MVSLGMFSVPVPPHQEQATIVRRLGEDTFRFTTALSHLEREIALLREYRTRLVADVVTGKLDVREAVKGLPEEREEEDKPDGSNLSDGLDGPEETEENP